MSKKLKFLWIDDNPELREPESKNMEKRLGVNIDFKDVKTNDLDKCLVVMLNEKQPDLILIDHKFDDNKTGIFKTGSTIAALIRDTWPTCPIICVTGINIDEVDSQKRSLYEAVLQFHDISKYDDTILSIAKSFKKISEIQPQNVNELLELLKAPSVENQKLETILPNYLKENFADKGLSTNLSNWIRNILIERPGFLYDKLWTSTLLGIKEDSFHKVEEFFKSAKYKGLFADNSKPRWWKASILEILSKKVKQPGLSFEKGRSLNRIEKKDYSKCYVDDTDYPETVAFEDQTSFSKSYPMKLQNTVSHPAYSDMLFFEEIRLMKPKE